MVWHVCAPAYSCKPKRSADAPRMFENNLQTIRKILGTNFVDDLLHYKKKRLVVNLLRTVTNEAKFVEWNEQKTMHNTPVLSVHNMGAFFVRVYWLHNMWNPICETIKCTHSTSTIVVVAPILSPRSVFLFLLSLRI